MYMHVTVHCRCLIGLYNPSAMNVWAKCATHAIRASLVHLLHSICYIIHPIHDILVSLCMFPQIFCSDCSSYLAPLHYKSDKLGRVCQSCYESIIGINIALVVIVHTRTHTHAHTRTRTHTHTHTTSCLPSLPPSDYRCGRCGW